MCNDVSRPMGSHRGNPKWGAEADNAIEGLWNMHGRLAEKLVTPPHGLSEWLTSQYCGPPAAPVYEVVVSSQPSY